MMRMKNQLARWRRFNVVRASIMCTEFGADGTRLLDRQNICGLLFFTHTVPVFDCIGIRGFGTNTRFME
jgi:hypothetical protein